MVWSAETEGSKGGGMVRSPRMASSRPGGGGSVAWWGVEEGATGGFLARELVTAAGRSMAGTVKCGCGAVREE